MPEESGVAGLRVEELDRPSPGQGELLVRVDAAALNFSDLLMMEGKYQIRPSLPFTPGQEIAGIVAETGRDTGLACGSRVAGKVEWGGFANYAILRSDMAIRIPDSIGIAAAACLPVVYTTALVALGEDAAISEGETILIHAAAGGLGSAALQVAKARGARVIAAVTGSGKKRFVANQGAELAIDYEKEDFVSAVLEFAKGGADVILDSVGGEVTRQSLRCLARKGQLLIAGFSGGEIAHIPANRLLLRRAVVRGIYWNHDLDRKMVDRCTRELVDLCAAGTIRPVVDDRYEFDDLPLALGRLKSGETIGKLALRMTGAGSPA